MSKSLSMALALVMLIASATVVAAGQTRPIRIGYLQADIHQLACWVALDKGFYQDEGLKVEVAGVFKAGPEEMSAFIAGELDMGYVGEAPATTAVANGAAKVVVLAQVNTEGSAVVVAKHSPIKRVQDLAGRLSAVPGHSTVQDFLLKKALAQAAVPAGKAKVVVIKPPEMIPALRSGQIASFIAWEPYPARAQSSGVGRVLVRSGEIWPDHPCCVLVADQRFLKTRRAEALKMVRAHVRATDFIRRHPEQALAIGVKYTGMDAATVRLAMANVKYTYHISVDGEKQYVRFLAKLGYIKVKDADAFVKRFLHGELLAEVLQK